MVNTGMSTSTSSSSGSSSSNQSLASVPTAQLGGKKSNGHKLHCKCPICKNMMKHKKNKKGGADDDQSWDIEMGPKQESSPSTPVQEGNYDAYDAAEKGEAGPNVVGGTRKRKTRKGKKSHKKHHKKSHKKRHTRKNRSSKNVKSKKFI